MRSLWPMITSGAPGSAKPSTLEPAAVRWITYHSAGMESCKCVSFASNGFPDAVYAPLTTKLLLPMISLVCSSNCARNVRAASQTIGANGGAPVLCASAANGFVFAEVFGELSCDAGDPAVQM